MASTRWGKATTVGLAILLAMAPLAGLGAGASGGREAACQEPYREPGIGYVCEVDGVYQLVDPQTGRSLGYTHGTDELAASTVSSSTASTIDPAPLTCSEASYGQDGEYYSKIFYANASDDTSRYPEVVDDMRGLAEKANRLLLEAGKATGTPANLIAQCALGDLTVEEVHLPGTREEYSDLGAIMDDMRAMGYDAQEVQHWVYYDEVYDAQNRGCRGLGNWYDDDRLTEANWNNGNAASMHAVMEGCLPGEEADGGGTWTEEGITRLWLHELSHTMGAVQTSAPNHADSATAHCTDGEDVMCPASRPWASEVCSTLRYDCNKDDYFHTNPSSESYLANHWNIGDEVNRYIDFADTRPPSKVTGLALTDVGQTTVNLSWDPASDNVGVEHYNVYRAEGGSGLSKVASTTETSFSDAALAEDTNYTYEVTAADEAGNEGEASDPVEARTDGTPPTAVEELTVVDRTTSSIEVDWAPSSDDNTGLSHYNVYRGPSADELSRIARTVTVGYLDDGLDRGTTYVYEVSAVDEVGNEGEAAQAQAATLADGEAPELDVTHPRAGTVYHGCTLPLALLPASIGPLFAEEGCVAFTASEPLDTDSGLARLDVDLVFGSHVVDVLDREYPAGTGEVSIEEAVPVDRQDGPVGQALEVGELRILAVDHVGHRSTQMVDDVRATDAVSFP